MISQQQKENAIETIMGNESGIEAAVQILQESLLQQPNDSTAWYWLGEAFIRLSDFAQAEMAFRNAADNDPTNPDNWCILGNHLSTYLNDFHGAQKAYEQALAIDAKHMAALHGSSGVLETLGNTSGAQVMLRKIRSLDLIEQAIGFTDSGLHREALKNFQEALALDDSNIELRIHIGETMMELDRFEEAREYLEQATILAPANPLFWCKLGDYFLACENEDDAKTAYQRALELAPKYNHAWYGLSNILRQAGDLAGADDALRKAAASETSQS